MKKPFLIIILSLSLLGCTADDVGQIITIIETKPTFVKIVNELEEDFYKINSVKIDDREFKNFNIAHGRSKEIRLNIDELPLDLNGIEVVVTFSSTTRTLSTYGIIDLYEGGTTIIWLTGKEGCSGCGGHSIEWGWED